MGPCVQILGTQLVGLFREVVGPGGCGAQLVDTHYPVIPPWLRPMETEPQEVPTLRALISCAVTATSDQK